MFSQFCNGKFIHNFGILRSWAHVWSSRGKYTVEHNNKKYGAITSGYGIWAIENNNRYAILENCNSLEELDKADLNSLLYEYDNAEIKELENQKYIALSKNGKYKICFEEFILPPLVNEIARGGSILDFLKLKSDNKCGIYYKGNELIPIKYDEIIYDDIGCTFFVKQNGKYGLYDTKGKILFQTKFNYEDIKFLIYPFNAIKNNGKFGINKYIYKKFKIEEENQFIPVEYDEITFDNDKRLINLKKEGKLIKTIKINSFE